MSILSTVAPFLCVVISYLVAYAGSPAQGIFGVQAPGGLSYTKYLRECTHEVHTDVKTAGGELLRSSDSRMRVRVAGRSVSIEMDGKRAAGTLTEEGIVFDVRPNGPWSERAAKDALAMHFEHVENRPRASGRYELAASGGWYQVHAEASPSMAVSSASWVDDYTGESHAMHWKTKLGDGGRAVEAEVRSLSHVPVIGVDTTLTFDTKDFAKCTYIKQIGSRTENDHPGALALSAPRFLFVEDSDAVPRATGSDEKATPLSSIRTRASTDKSNGLETRGSLRGEIILGKPLNVEIVHETKNASQAGRRAIAGHIQHQDLADVGLYAAVEGGGGGGINATFNATRDARVPAHSLVHYLNVDISYDFTSTEIATATGFELASRLVIRSGETSDVSIEGVVYNATIGVDRSTQECTVSRMVQDSTSLLNMKISGAGGAASFDTPIMDVSIQDDYCDSQQIISCEHEFNLNDEEGDEPVQVKTRVVEVRTPVAPPLERPPPRNVT